MTSVNRYPSFTSGKFGRLRFDHMNNAFGTIAEVERILPDLIALLAKREPEKREKTIRPCVLVNPEPIDEDEEPYPTRFRAEYREIEGFFNEDDEPVFRVKPNGWTSVAGNKRTWAVMAWEQSDPCEFENADCTEESVPVAAETCEHQNFTPDSLWTLGTLKRMIPASVESEDLDGCLDRPPIVYIKREPIAQFVEELECNPDPESETPQPRFMAVAIGPIRYCVACPEAEEE